MRPACWLAVGLLAATTSPAQAPEPTAPAFHEEVAVQQVLVPVVVRERGRYLRELEAKDFRLRVDGAPVSFESFERGDTAPIHVVFLQDLSGSMAIGDKLSLSRKAIQSVLSTGRAGDVYTVVGFAADAVDVGTWRFHEVAALRRAMQGWAGKGRTALHDAVSRLPMLGLGAATTRRGVLLLTDGLDNASAVTPAEARAAAQRADMPVYVLDLGLSGRNLALRRNEPPPRNGALLVLSHLTGGRYFTLLSSADLEAAIEIIGEELRSQYVLGFTTAGGAASIHTLKVEVHGKRRTATHRREYRGGPPAIR